MVRMWGGMLALLIAGCHSAPWSHPGASRISPEAAALAGQRAAPALLNRYGGVDRDIQAGERLAVIGQRVADANPELEIEWRFQLLTSRSINAFSLPGGLIYVTRGLYDRIGADDQVLAAAIAHEMAHVCRNDSLKPRCCSTEVAVAREMRADEEGARLLKAGPYPARAMLRLLEMIKDQQSSGIAGKRIEHLREHLLLTAQAATGARASTISSR